ncbi:MAG: hypothetical protein QW562_04635 [Thermosphaera sp.]
MMNKVIASLKTHAELVIANTVALFLAASSWNYYDVRYFLEWYSHFVSGRILDIYGSSIYDKIAYPPLPILLFVSTHHVAVTLSSNIEIIRLIDKIPLIISFNLIYFILRREYGRRAGVLWLANATGYIILIGYQFDLIASLFLLLGFIQLVRNKFEKACIYLTLAVLVKQILAPFLLLPFIVRLKSKRYDEMVRLALNVAVVGSIFVLPFLVVDPYSFIGKVLFFHASRYPQELSLFAIPLYVTWYNVNVLPSWLTWIWILPFTIYTGLAIFYFAKEREYGEEVFLKYFIYLLTGLLVFNKIGGFNYFTWLAPFIIIFISRRSTDPGMRVFQTLFISIPLIVHFIYNTSTLFAAAVASDEVFIVEDLNWVSAEEIILRSSGSSSLIYSLVQACRANPLLSILFSMMNRSKPVSQIFFTLIYNAYLTYVWIKVKKLSRSV